MNVYRLLAGVMLVCILQSGCVQPSEHGSYLSPSELNVNSLQYNGKMVTVRAYVTLVPAGHNLYESQSLNAEFRRHVSAGGKDDFKPRAWDKYCLTIANPGPMYKHPSAFNKKTLTIRGKFIDDYLNSRMIDLGACPLPTAIIVDYTDLQRRYPSLFREH